MTVSTATITDLKMWLADLVKYNKVDSYVDIVIDSGEGDTNGDYEHRFVVHLYTSNYRYAINAVEGSHKSYLGCQVATRMPRPGEQHTRGNDLHDGPLSYDTWLGILKDIIAYELVELAPSRDYIADDKEEVGIEA